MKKAILSLLILTFLQIGLYADKEYLLGNVKSRIGKVNVIYVEAKRTHIRIEINDTKVNAVIYIPMDIDKFRAHADKFIEWHQIALDNDYELNKKIGEVSTFKIDFITYNKKYEIALSNLTGMRLMTFDLTNLKKLLEVISDENIDKVIHEKARAKTKEDELFK